MLKNLKDDVTCVLLHNNNPIFTSGDFGVKPLIEYLKTGQSYKNLVLVDRIVGKAAVMLAEKSGVKTIYTPIASTYAIDYATMIGITLYFKKHVPFIENRSKDGMCPIEQSVVDIHDCERGFTAITDTIKELMKKQ
jgi:hypothetical protein